MSHYLVTGGTGFLGEYVVRQLVSVGHRVRVLARSFSRVFADLDSNQLEMVRGDVLDPASVRAAIETASGSVDGIFHLAGMVSREPVDTRQMMRVHVDGTRVVMRCAKAAAVGSVPRVVLASSSGTIAVSKTAVVHHEESGFALELAAKWPYYASKIYQEKAALELAAQLDIELVVISPSLLLGPGDRRLSSTKDIRRFLRGQIPSIPNGGLNFVDARDAAVATVNAMEKGRPGQRYLLGGPNWTCREFFAKLSRVAKSPGPRLKLPKRLSEMGASLLERSYRAAGKEPPVDRMGVEMAEHFWYVDSSKAVRELGFSSRDPQLTLHDTVAYLRRDLDS